MSATKPHPPKVLVTKIGLDGHDRGSRVVAAFLRDAGMEVLYTPPWQEIDQVVRLAEEEDVGGIGPDADERKLKRAGVREIFHPGASREEIVCKVATLAREARAAKNKEL